MGKAPFADKHPLVQLLWLVLILAGGLCIFSAFSIFFSFLIWGENPVLTANYYRFTQTLSTIGTFLVPALLFGFLATGKWFSYARADVRITGKDFGIVLLLAIPLLPLNLFFSYCNEAITLPDALSGVAQWMAEMEKTANDVLELLLADVSVPTLLVNIFFLAIIPAFCEEILFRGTLQTLFAKWFLNKHVAVFVTAFIFSAIHLQFAGFIPRFLSGVYLGYLFVWSGSLWLPVIAHLLHNSFTLIVQFIATKNDFSLEESATTNMSVFLPIVIVSAIIFVVGLYFLQKRSIDFQAV